MVLKNFAKSAGVVVKQLDAKEAKQWGGAWSYSTEDSPNCRVMVLKTEEACYTSWAKSAFGEKAAKALIRLLRKNKQLEAQIKEMRERS